MSMKYHVKCRNQEWEYSLDGTLHGKGVSHAATSIWRNGHETLRALQMITSTLLMMLLLVLNNIDIISFFGSLKQRWHGTMNADE
jgi:hypothetical protein